MARRKIEIIIAGDSSSLKRALGESSAALSTFDKATQGFGGNMATGALAATPALLGLTGALVSVGASATAAIAGAGAVGIGGLGALGVGLGSIALVAKPAADSFKKVTTALDAYNLVLDQHGAKSKQAIAAQTKLNAIVKENGGAPVLKAVKAWDSLGKAFTNATGPARVTMFKTLATGIGSLRSVIPTVAGIANKSMASLGKALEVPFKMLKGNEFGQILRSLGNTFSKAIGPGISAVSNVLLGFGRIARQSGGFVVELSKSIEGLTKKFADATGNPDHLRAVIRNLVDQTKAWIGLGVSMGKVLRDLFKGSAESGKSLVEGLTGALDKLDAKMNTVAGQRSLHQFFHQAAQLTTELAQALPPVLKALGTLSVGVMPTYIAIAGKLKGIMGPLTYAFVAYKVAAVVATVAIRGYTSAVTIGTAAVKVYRAAMIALTAIRFGWASMTAQAATGGGLVGKAFAVKMASVAAAGIAGWEIGTWISKHVPAVRNAANGLAKAVGDALGTSSSVAQKLDGQMAKITSHVQALAQAFKNASNPVDRNTAALRLHVIAANASVAQLKANVNALHATGIAAIDGAAKTAKLKAANDALKAAEQNAAQAAANLRNQINSLHDKTIRINTIITNTGVPGTVQGSNRPAGRGGGPKAKGSSFHPTGPPLIFGLQGSLASEQSLRDQTQAGFDAQDQAARRSADLRGRTSKDKSTRQSAIADLKALNTEIARTKQLGAIDLKITGYEKAIAFKDAISQIRDSIHGLTQPLADKHRTDLTDAIAGSADAQELARLQGQDAQAQDAATTKQLNDALQQAIASGDIQAQKDAQDAIDAYARQKREATLAANIQAANDAVDGEVTTYQQGLDDQVSALVDSLDQRKSAYADFVNALAAMGITFTASSDQEQAIDQTVNPSGVGNQKKKVKGHKKTKKPKHRAMGGPVAAGESYIVGETGQEVFTPDSNGSIIPNGRLAGASVHMEVHNMRVGSNVDMRREMNRLAFRLSAA